MRVKKVRLTTKFLPYLCFILLISCQKKEQNVLRIAVASSLTEIFRQAIIDYERANPQLKIQLTTAASGKIVAMNRLGKKFDFVVLADSLSASEFLRNGNGASVESFGDSGLMLFARKPFSADTLAYFFQKYPSRKICLPNPATAPVGKAAAEFLRNAQIPAQNFMFADNSAAVLILAENEYCDFALTSDLFCLKLHKKFKKFLIGKSKYKTHYFYVLCSQNAKDFLAFAKKHFEKNKSAR
jgi:ABC-type molybdate transport system substrate-binding protein